MDKPQKNSRTGRLIRLAGMLVSTGLFVGLIARQDLSAAWRCLSEIPLWTIPLILLLYYLGMVCNAVRWSILLRAQQLNVSFTSVVKIVFAGAFASNFLPSTIGGDAVRVIGLQQRVNNWVVSTSSIVVDRLLNVLAMVASSPLSLVTFGPGLFRLFQSSGAAPAGVSAGLFFGRLPGSQWLYRRIWLPLKEALGLWWNQPGYLALAFVVSWLSVFVVFIAVWWIARGLGIQVALYQVIGINVITYLLTLVPVSFNGYGVREFAMASLYVQLGASLEQASALALITRIFMLFETLPGAFWLAQVMPERFSAKK